MNEWRFSQIEQPISGTMKVPGDKSISHRAIMFGSLAKGITRVSNFLESDDCLHTLEAFRKLGVPIERNGSDVIIHGQGIDGLKEPVEPLYFGNSGTTARLMIGILAGLPLFTVIYGDEHLSKRPMDRVVIPLKEMGLNVEGRAGGHLLPLAIKGSKLTGITYKLPVKSAQVKSAILLAGLQAEGQTKVIETGPSRDHTEQMLKAFGADIHVNGLEITITNRKPLIATDVHVPGDISSAAFWLVAAAIVPGSRLTIKHVGLNHTRTGILDVMKAMGGKITITNEKQIGGETFGDVTVTQTELTGTTIDGDLIPRLIDEIPIIALLATQANGKTVIRDAEELRVKETDRIDAVVDVLRTLGAKIESLEDGMIIHGKTPLHGGIVKSYSDHRMAMMAIIASLIAKEDVVLDDIRSIAVSYPQFLEDLKRIKTGQTSNLSTS